jgi:putative ABC transport system ATP-binding protein
VIEVQDLGKYYQRGDQQITVLDGLNLTVADGEFVALMGPSGSGKSTLLNLIAGIDRPSAGRIVIGGIDVSQLSESELAKWRSRHVGFIFQFYNLIPVLTAAENVALPLTLTDCPAGERADRVAKALAAVGLSDRAGHIPSELSGGQQQRVAIARALITNPSLIVADEPTGDLDRKSAQDVLAMLQQLNRESGKTIVMVTHDPKAADAASRVVHLEKGQLMAQASH